MKEIILIKNGELALKGLNRRNFEKTLKGGLKASAEPRCAARSLLYI